MSLLELSSERELRSVSLISEMSEAMRYRSLAQEALM